jgi:hypothetical protein
VSDISKLLHAWSEGDQNALERLTPVVYDELHRLARRYMRRERPGHSLQTTALVNEAYMRLLDYKRIEWPDRAHFYRDFGPIDEAHSGGACAAPQPETRGWRAACLPGRSPPWWAAAGPRTWWRSSMR